MSTALAGGAGIVLFTVQHNFERSYASGDQNWDYDTAAIHGTSFLALPAWLNWFTANIGYHHVHHLCARIPNYRLAACHAEHAHLFGAVKRLTLADIGPSLKFVLWDPGSRRIISVAEHESASIESVGVPSARLG
ncbi:MAG: fatty acid desaturase [Nevskia sp.]|nr:fatty acid desaturase [Nevskia sp.]